jgi:2-keto-3-deoxy-L-rhamnonate aldolase RhmA
MGMRFVAVGSDLGVLRTQSKALADKFRDAAGPGLAAQY